MTNLEKMNELVGDSENPNAATKEQIKDWAYINRIHIVTLAIDEEKFHTMENSVSAFVNSDSYGDNEFENWDKFLDSKYIAAE